MIEFAAASDSCFDYDYEDKGTLVLKQFVPISAGLIVEIMLRNSRMDAPTLLANLNRLRFKSYFLTTEALDRALFKTASASFTSRP